MDIFGPYGRCRCGRPLQVISARSWTAPEELSCLVCDEGMEAEAFDRWMEGPPEPDDDPFDFYDRGDV